MDRNEFINICNSKLKLVRTEFSFSQDKMANMLGISKKTLVEIEKGRSSLGWSGSVVLCSVFFESQILRDAFTNGVLDTIHCIAFENSEPEYRRTHSHSIWWQTIAEDDNYILEQNIVSQHYRLINKNYEVIASSFNMEDLKVMMNMKGE